VTCFDVVYCWRSVTDAASPLLLLLLLLLLGACLVFVRC
jgi:hypothetical protein